MLEREIMENENNDQNLPNATNEPTISNNPEPQDIGAGQKPEDTPIDFAAIQKQQSDMLNSLQQQNQLLVEQNQRLNDQIGMLLRNGAVITDNGQNPVNDERNPMPNIGAPDTAAMYTNFCDLGKDIGK